MNTSIAERELVELYARARSALLAMGHSSVRYKKEIIRLMSLELGVVGMNEVELLRAFLSHCSSRCVASPSKFVKDRPYMFDRAMQQAASKCADMPVPITIS